MDAAGVPTSQDGDDPFANGANPFAAIAAASRSRDTGSSTAPTDASDPPRASASSNDAADPFANGANPFAAIAAAPRNSSKSGGPDTRPLANSSDDGTVSSTLKNVGTTAIRGLSHAPGFVGDIAGFADALTEIPEWVESKVRGQPFADVVAKRNALGAKSQAEIDATQRGAFGFSLDPRHYFPSGAEVAAPILKQTGAYEPTSALGRYSAAAGEAALGAFGPGGGNMVRGVLRHALPNAAAGLSSQAASDATGGDPLAASVAGFGPGAAFGAAKGALDTATRRRAASVLSGNASDPQAALAKIQQGQANPIDGVKPTTAELTGDEGLGRLQDMAASTNARGPQFDTRRREQSRGLANAVDDLLPGADPGRVATFFSQHFDDIGDRTQSIIDGHLAAAQAHADVLRGRGLPVDAYGAELRSNIANVEDARSKAEGQMWAVVDPENKLTNDMTGVKAAAGKIYGDMPAADRAFMSPAEQSFANMIDGFKEVEPFRQVAALKSNLATAMRRELSDNGSTPAYARMSRLMGPVQDTINGTLARRAAADNAAVTAGTMAPEDTLGSKLDRILADHEQQVGQEAGRGTGREAVAAGAGAAPLVPGASGANRQGDQRPGASPRSQAVQGDVARTPAQGGPGSVGPVYYPGGATGVRYELAEHGDLVTSHDADFRPRADYPQNLQPRARDSAGARDQVNGMAARLQPERLGPSPEANAGAPIVGPDNVVESGNGRTMAIGKAYDAGRGAAYRQHLESLGFDTSDYRKPVLVGRRVMPMTPDQREFFTHAANDATALRMGSAEQAAADANKITPAMLDSQAGPNLAAAANKPFVSAFMAKLPAAERGALVDKGGNLSQAGVRRIQAAVTAQAYSDHGLLSRAFDDADPNVKGMVGALTDAAGPWAKMRAAISDGSISPDHDVTPELLQGVKLAMRARDEGRPIGELLAQGDLFNSETSRLVTSMLTKDGARLAPRPQIEANLRAYAEEAVKNASGDRLIGSAAPVHDVLRASQDRAARETGSQPSKLLDGPIFDDVPPAPTANYDREAAERYQAANAASKERHRIYGAQPIADVLAERGGRGNYKMPASSVPGRLFTGGPGGFEKVQAFREAVGDDRAAMHLLRDHALDDLQREARKPDGTLDDKQLAKWRDKHADALRAYPELSTQLESAAAATRTLNEASAQRRDLIKAYQKSVFGKLMDASHPEEVNHIIAAALKRPDRVMAMRKLAQTASADPMALDGLRQSVLEHVVGRSIAEIESASGPTRTMKAKAFLDLYKQQHQALHEVLGTRSTEVLQRVAETLPRIAQSVEKGGKNYAGLMRYLEVPPKPHESLLERLWKPAFAFREVSEIGGKLAGEYGEMLAGAGATIGLGKKAVQAIRATGARKVGDVITDALLNPEQYAALLAQAPTKPDTGAAATLAYQLRRSAMYGGDAISRVTAHLATRAPRFADRADDRRRNQPARAAGGRVGDDEPVAHITGEEIAPHGTDDRTLRQATREWFRRTLKGSSVKSRLFAGPVRFGSSDKAISSSADTTKLRLFPAVPHVLDKGQLVASNPPVDPAAEPSTKAYHFVEAPVMMGDVKHVVGATVREDTNGHYYYNHNDMKDDGQVQDGNPETSADKAGPGEASGPARTGNVGQGDDVSKRARGGGILGGGSGTGPFGVPTFGQMYGPGIKAGKPVFADGGVVRKSDDDRAKERASAFAGELRMLHAAMKRRDEDAVLMSSLPTPDPVAHALHIAHRQRRP